jgi:hypothetical protein
MGSCRRACLWLVLAAAASQIMAEVSFAQLREPPVLLRMLWPFGQQRVPAPLARQDRPRPRRVLIAPFVLPKVDINTCTLADLQNLPGVDASMAAHIFAGRPYRDFGDLQRDGVPLNTVERLRGVISFGPRPD